MKGSGLFDFIGSLFGGAVKDVSLDDLMKKSDPRVKPSQRMRLMPIQPVSNAKKQIGGLLRKY